MTNNNPLWKILLLGAVLITGAVIALPNLFGNDPAVQVSGRGQDLRPEQARLVREALEESDLQGVEFRDEDNRLVALVQSEEDQLKAYDIARSVIEPATTTAALNLVSASPGWLRNISNPMYLGLDLRGGVHFLMQVDMEAALASALERYVSDWKREVRSERIRGTSIQQKNGRLTARFREEDQRDKMWEVFGEEGFDLDMSQREEGEYFYVDAVLTQQAEDTERRSALQQNIITLRNRINELGVSEPVIQQQGLDRIVVQLPGVQDTARAKEILGATATLEYRLVYGSYADWADAANGSVPSGARLYTVREDGSPILLNRDIIVTGDQIKDASSGFDQQSGSPAVFVNLDGAGARRMQDVTQENVGNLMAVVFSENRVDTTIVDGEEVRKTVKTEEVINTATIRDVLSHRFQTTGLDGREATDLALLLRAGALKAPVEIVEERTIGPSLGKDNIKQGFLSAVAGLALVLVFMTWYYRLFGVIAGIALVVNVVLIVAVLSLLQATLTLPGIAGIVLTTGMAVDANVLIFERIREELRAGSSTQAAISAGYDKAFVTIADANITTLIAAVVLFGLGTGPIKGFAITLCIGILTSMFTAIFASRVFVNAIYGGKRAATLAI